jgi:hypothetical protein
VGTEKSKRSVVRIPQLSNVYEDSHKAIVRYEEAPLDDIVEMISVLFRVSCVVIYDKKYVLKKISFAPEKPVSTTEAFEGMLDAIEKAGAVVDQYRWGMTVKIQPSS